MKESVRNEIVRLSEQGLSQRRIAQQLQVSRHTVHDALQQVATARAEGMSAVAPTRPARRGHSLDAFDDVIGQLLERYANLTAQRLWEELRQRGFTGSYPTVWRRLRQLRPELPHPGSSQRHHRLVAGQRRRRARARRDQGATCGPARPGSAAPAALADAPVGSRARRVSTCVGGGFAGVASEPVLGALAAHRPTAGGAHHGRRVDRLWPAPG
jgi:transposase